MAKEIVENKEEIVENKEETTEKNDLVEAIIETDATDEEVVQSVAEAIVEEAEKNDKTIEEVTEEIIKEAKPEKKDTKKVTTKALDIIAQSRGFNSIKEAEAYVESEGFGKLHVLDQNEFKNWLKEIKK